MILSNEKINKTYTGAKLGFMFGLLLLGVFLVMFFAQYNLEEQAIRKSVPLSSAVEDMVGNCAYIKAEELTEVRRLYGKNGFYYLAVSDGKSYGIHIDKYSKLRKAMDDLFRDGSVALSGRIAYVPANAMDKEGNAVPYLGLDVVSVNSPLTPVKLMFFEPEKHFLLPGIVFVFMLSFLIVYGFRLFRFRRYANMSVSEADIIDRELDSPDTLWLPVLKCYVTKNYFVNVGSGLIIAKLKDIVWVYSTEMYHNGIKQSENTSIMLSDGKLYKLGYVASGTFRKKQEAEIKKELDSIVNAVYKHNPYVIYGIDNNIKKDMKNKYGRKI